MLRQSLLRLAACLLFGLLLQPAARAAEMQVKTVDGQTVQGEYLGTDNGIIKLRSKFGVLEIAAKDVVSMKEVAVGKRVAPAQPEPKEEDKKEEAATPPAPPPEPEPAAPAPNPAPASAPAHPARTFPEPRLPDVVALANARAARFPVPEADKNARQEIFRALRNFPDTNAGARRKIVRTLQDYGRMAEPFIAPAFPSPAEIYERVDILEALAVPGRTFSTPMFAETHKVALAAMDQTDTGPPPMPPEYISRRDRDRPMLRSDLLKLAAANVLDIEGYASTAGGPFNALFLLDIYKKRYTSEKTSPLLLSVARDRTRLAATAADANRSRSSWTRDDKVMLDELALPLLFKDNDDLAVLAKDFLTRLLPSGHPKWDAPQDDWVTWWEKAKEKMR